VTLELRALAVYNLPPGLRIPGPSEETRKSREEADSRIETPARPGLVFSLKISSRPTANMNGCESSAIPQTRAWIAFSVLPRFLKVVLIRKPKQLVFIGFVRQFGRSSVDFILGYGGKNWDNFIAATGLNTGHYRPPNATAATRIYEIIMTIRRSAST
jgi:hypothetical protein